MGSLGHLAAVGGPTPAQAEPTGLAALVGGNVASTLLNSPSGMENATTSTAGGGAMTETRKLRPPGRETKLIVYLEDMYLSHTDRHSDQPGVEALRDYLTCSSWYSTRKKGMR